MTSSPTWRTSKQTLAGERRGYRMDKRYVRKDGEIVWASLSVSLVRDAEGAPLVFVSQIEDITERRRLIAELEQRGTAHGSRARRDHRPRRRPQHGALLERGGRAGLRLSRQPLRLGR